MDKKVQKLSLKDFVKDTPPGLRLKSIRLPRDLSLGGTKLRKKEYKPNVNVVRHKSKPQNALNRITKTKSKQRNVHEEKSRQRFVQSTGLFCEGIGLSNITPKAPVIETNPRKPEKSTRISQPPIIKDSHIVDQTVEDIVIDNIIKCSSSDSESEEKCPFDLKNWSLVVESETKSAVKLGWCPLSEMFLEIADPKPKITLWKMPSSLAFRADDNTKTTKSTDCNLTDLPQGKIGKISIRKSGKIEAFFGDIKYDLESAELKSFYETLVSINVRPENSEALVVGDIDSRCILTPDWSYLLRGK